MELPHTALSVLVHSVSVPVTLLLHAWHSCPICLTAQMEIPRGNWLSPWLNVFKLELIIFLQKLASLLKNPPPSMVRSHCSCSAFWGSSLIILYIFYFIMSSQGFFPCFSFKNDFCWTFPSIPMAPPSWQIPIVLWFYIYVITQPLCPNHSNSQAHRLPWHRGRAPRPSVSDPTPLLTESSLSPPEVVLRLCG